MRRIPFMSPSLMSRFSHELRTSLTGIVSYAEFLETGSNESMVSFTAKIIRESGQSLSQATSAYFDLENLSRGEVRLTCTRSVFSDVLREIVQEHQDAAADRDVTLIFKCNESLLSKTISTDIQRLRGVLSALISGVIQMLHPWSVAHVELTYSESRYAWFLSIAMSNASNDGRSMDLFKSFWNDEEYKFRLQEGPGVVLASAKSMLEFLGAYAKFEDAASTDAPRLVVIFPFC